MATTGRSANDLDTNFNTSFGAMTSALLMASLQAPTESPSRAQDSAIVSVNDLTTIEWIFAFVAVPMVSIPGLVGNVSSLIVLYRHGFKKTSNILLVALSIADACYLIGVNNIPAFMHEYSTGRGFHYSVTSCYVLYGLYRLYRLLELWGNWTSLTLPVLITIERLVAVYHPFKFPLLVTPRRTLVAVVISYLLWLPLNVYYFFLEDLVFVQQGGVIVGRIVPTRYYQDKAWYSVYLSVKKAAIILSEPIPILLVVIGCFMVGVKIRLAHAKRRKMMYFVSSVTNARATPAFRTSWTLLLVCIVYSITIGTAFFLEMGISVDVSFTANIVLAAAIRLVKCIHSSCNFFIYIYINRNFQETYRSIFASWVRKHGHK
ncbi:probable G-protein coupled receptor B0563.6 [Biomphalaria glabrata]|uniref:Probable G-protein coupled receptor B0563.6 n=1 Tax=Biomphalaria glabrata TaxID=6526 RepID=A0A9U8ED79_BIOGL|nr:probable G-protein coupled receptor B0563.6 [Biomphalaria glabrata]